MKITHQTQPTSNSCVCTCLAMLANKPAMEVVERFHDAYLNDRKSLLQIMEELDIVAVPISSGMIRSLRWGELYVVCTPSLNVEGGTHQILIDLRDDKADTYLFDPAKGRKGRKAYVDWQPRRKLKSNERKITGYVPEFRILDCPVMRS